MNIRVTAGKLAGQPGRIVEMKSKEWARVEVATPSKQMMESLVSPTFFQMIFGMCLGVTKITLHVSEYEVM